MADIVRYTITEPYLNLSCGLGEAPFYEAATMTLRFVDIVKKKLHEVKIEDGPESHRSWSLAHSIGTTADITDNSKEIIFGGKSGYGILNKETGEHHIIRQMWTDEERKDDQGGKTKAGGSKEHRMRSNDGAVDAKGRYFVGAMNDPAVVDNITDEGILFRLDPDLSIHRVKANVSIPNGISWSPDNKTMFFTDSPTGKIMAYPYNMDTGEASFDQGKVFFTCPYEGGVPDGHCRDAEGFLWVAFYGWACESMPAKLTGEAGFGTGKVVRVDQLGNVVAEIEVPTRCVTCPAFAGTELFITSAEEEEPEKYPWSTKYQGALFKIDVGVAGSSLHKFNMPAGV